MEPFIGEIRMFGGNFAPLGWALCDGQILSIAQNDVLFNLIGTIYGGDGQTTFALPDLRGRLPIHAGTMPGGSNFILGEQAGTETVTLTTNQMPNHTHPFLASTSPANSPSPNNTTLAQAEIYVEDVTQSNMGDSTTSSGGSQPHDNMMPYLCVTFIIALEGIFPSQN